MPNHCSASLVFSGFACLLIAGVAGTIAGCRSPQTAGSAASPVTYSRLGPAEVIKDAVPCEAKALPLSDVRLTGGPLKHAQELDAQYLIKLDPDQIMYYLRK